MKVAIQNPHAVWRKQLELKRHLEDANRIRVRRSALKKHLKAQTVSLTEVLHRDKDYIQTMQFRDLLLATPKIGIVRAERALRVMRASPSIQIRCVSMKRREALLEWLAEHFPEVNL